jgi:hypothetical protein
MNYKILQLDGSQMIFECHIEGLEMEVRVNCEVDENHEDGLGLDTLMLDCPTMPMEEINIKRFVRDFKILGVRVIPTYEERFASK